MLSLCPPAVAPLSPAPGDGAGPGEEAGVWASGGDAAGRVPASGTTPADAGLASVPQCDLRTHPATGPPPPAGQTFCLMPQISSHSHQHLCYFLTQVSVHNMVICKICPLKVPWEIFFKLKHPK